MGGPDGPGQPVWLSRRTFVGGAVGAASLGFAPLLRLLPRSTVAAAFGQRPELRFFDEHQAAVVVEATARLVPGPTDDPAETTGGAREAGVVHYIDLFLSAFDEDPPRIFAGGPTSDRHGGATDEMARFVPLAPWEEKLWRERVAAMGETYRTGIAELDAAAGGDFTTVTPEARDAILAADTRSGFRRVLFTHTIEGLYAVPEYGGNAELVGWNDIGYAGDVAPEGWTSSQVSESDGPDPVPDGFELPFPATLVSEAEQGGAPDTNPPAPEPAAAGGDDPEGAAAVAGVAEPAAFLAAALPGLGRWRTRPPGTRRDGGRS